MADSDQELEDTPDAPMEWDQQVDFKPYSGPPTYQSGDWYGADGRFYRADSAAESVQRSQDLAAQFKEADERREATEQCRDDAYNGTMTPQEFAVCNGFDPSVLQANDPSTSRLDQAPAPTVGPVTPEQQRSFDEAEENRRRLEDCEKLPDEQAADACKADIDPRYWKPMHLGDEAAE